MNLVRRLINTGIAKVVCSKLGDDSDENLLRWINFFKKNGCGYERDIQVLEDSLEGKRKRIPYLNLLKAVLSLESANAKFMFHKNIIYNAGIKGNLKRTEFEKRNGFQSPLFLVISPTMNCNLRCNGCYAGNYDRESLDYGLVNNIIKEGKSIGTYFYVLSGGEVFTWKDDGRSIFNLFESHQDAYFLIYTNGTLIDKKTAKRMEQAGNVALALSVEGFEKETDSRRGKGVWKKVLQAMDNLAERGMFFGYSSMVTKGNEELISSDEFVDFYYDRGCRFGWYFQFLPIGKDPDVEMMATPEQREHLRMRADEIRDRKRNFSIGDFWNDGCLMDGCIAAGKKYVHINSNGDVEPCAFVHFAVDNIEVKSLEEVLKSDFFRNIRSRQPYSNNLYAPCMIIDNPQILREAAGVEDVRPTHVGAECVVRDAEITTYLDDYSRRVHELTDALKNPYEV